MTEVIVLTGDDAGKSLHHVERKLDRILQLLQEGNYRIMSQLSDILVLINDETNLISQSAADDATATQEVSTKVDALLERIRILIEQGGTPNDADLAALAAIQASLASTKTSLDATATRLREIAADPNNPVPTP